MLHEQLDLPLLLAGGRPTRLREGSLGNERLGLALRRGRKLPNGQPVGVCGRHGHPFPADLQEDPREDGPGLVPRGCPGDLPDAFGERGGVHRHPRAPRVLEGGEVLRGEAPDGALVVAARDPGLATVRLHEDGGLLEALHHVREEPRRDERHPLPLNLHLEAEARRHLQVRGGQHQLGPRRVHQHTRQRRDARA